MKTAVFEIHERTGEVYLVCVPLPNLRSALTLEEWLKLNSAPDKTIKFLGRFDQILGAVTLDEAELLILGNSCGTELGYGQSG